jgi:hypothetical protein
MRHLIPSHFWFCVSALAAVACASTGGTRPAEAAAPPQTEHAHTGHPESEPAGASPSAAPAGSQSPAGAAAMDTGGERQSLARAERVAYEKAKPVFEAYCAPCHTSQSDKSGKSALQHFSMDSYPFGGHHAREVTKSIRHVLGASGSKPTMPRDKPGAVQGEDLQLILAWAESYDRAHVGSEPSRDHSGGGHPPH